MVKRCIPKPPAGAVEGLVFSVGTNDLFQVIDGIVVHRGSDRGGVSETIKVADSKLTFVKGVLTEFRKTRIRKLSR